MARQKALPGMAKDAAIEEIEQAAEAYDKAASRSSTQRQKTADARDVLIQLMHDHKRTIYKAENGRTYTLAAGKEKVVVSDADQPAAEDDAGDDHGAN